MKIPVSVNLHGFSITWLKHVFVLGWGLERIPEALPNKQNPELAASPDATPPTKERT